MKGMSASVSSMLNHRDSPRVISHARGMPAARSRADTIRAIIKEFEIAPRDVLIMSGLSKMFGMVLTLMTIPKIGGMSMIAKKIMIAER